MCPFLSHSSWINITQNNLKSGRPRLMRILQGSCVPYLPTLLLASREVCVGESGGEDRVPMTSEYQC